MSDFPIFHGIALAQNSWIENLNVEVLASDPVPLGPGRLWFNSTDKKFKFSSLDAGGAVIVRSFYDGESAAAALSALQTALEASLAAEVARATAAEGQALTDAKAYTDAKKVETIAYVDAVKAELLGGIPPETLDTLNELAAALRNNPDIVNVIETKIGTDIAAAKEELKGTVTEAMDTLGEIEVALNAEIANRAAADTAEQQAREAADAGLDARITNVEGQVNGNIGNLATLHTTEKGTIVGAINEVADGLAAESARAIAAESAEATARAAADSAEATARAAADATLQANIDAEAATRGAADSAEATARADADSLIRSDYNAKRFTFQSGAAATVHTVAHNLGASFVDFTVLVQRADGKYRNDVVSVEEVDNNTLKVYLSVAAHVKVAVTSMASL